MSAVTQAQDAPPWWSSFPEPKAPVHALEPEDVAQLLESHASAGPNSTKSFLLVDVRRTDWEGGTIATSLNLPAHTLYQTRPVIYQLCKQANVKTIIFYCGELLHFITWFTKPPVRLTPPKQEARMAAVLDVQAGCRIISTKWAKQACQPPFSRVALKAGRRSIAVS